MVGSAFFFVKFCGDPGTDEASDEQFAEDFPAFVRHEHIICLDGGVSLNFFRKSENCGDKPEI